MNKIPLNEWGHGANKSHYFHFKSFRMAPGEYLQMSKRYYPGKKNVSCTKTTEWRSQRERKRSKINIRWEEKENRGKKHQTNDCFPKAYLFSCWTNRFLFVSNITPMPAFMKKNKQYIWLSYHFGVFVLFALLVKCKYSQTKRLPNQQTGKTKTKITWKTCNCKRWKRCVFYSCVLLLLFCNDAKYLKVY